MDKIGRKCREWVKVFGYVSAGIGFIGMVYISLVIVSVFLKFLLKPTVSPGVSLILPGMNIPGIGYLSFWYWIIAIVILSVVHEFSHGMVARAYDIKLKSSGFAIFGILAPILPAAFVEPDEKKLAKKKDIVQYSVLGAGPMMNMVLAFLILMALPYVIQGENAIAPFEDRFSESIGFSVEPINESFPAYEAGLTNRTLITTYNNNPVTSSDDLLYELYYCKKPGDTVILGNENQSFTITATEHPENKGRAYLGIHNIQNERRLIEGKEFQGKVFYWFKDLLRWLFFLNFAVGLINLLPIFATDGARMLKIFMDKIMKKKKSDKIWFLINITFTFILIISLFATMFF
ncbi:site-2 protease family protein [Candidatus Woesearchaeota archaeon]|nr:site-2 protease family protein [Candidatus Woesearchaeota archaeon]